MRKIVCIFSVMLSVFFTVSAQGRVPQPKAVLASMQEALGRLGTADFAFTFKAVSSEGEVLGDESGHFVAQGEAFRLTTDIMTVFCDGKTKWIYDTVNEEITVFPHDTASVDPAENPFAVLSKADASLYSFKGGVDVEDGDNSTLYTIRMSPKDKDEAFTELEITVTPDTFLPVAVEYTSRNADLYSLRILSVKSVSAMPADYFAPSQELLDDPDVYITDMR